MASKSIHILVMASCISIWAQADLTLTIRTGTRYQTMDNFATSAAFELNEITDSWNPSNLDNLAEMLFSTEIQPNGTLTGIGLSGFRVEIGACSYGQGSSSQIRRTTARSKCTLQSNGSYDWSQMDAELYWGRKSYEYGVHTLMGYSNSPPIYHTLNGLACRTQTSSVANLRSDAYDDFAEYLAQVAAHFESQGYPLHYISPVNEPQWEWICDSQEGTQWSSVEIRDLVVELQSAFTNNNISTKINITEAGSLDWIYNNWDNNLLTGQLRYWETGNPLYIGNLSVLAKHISGHSYWTEDSDTRLVTIRSDLASAIRSTDPDLAWWMTEYSLLGNGYQDLSNNPSNHELGLFMAKVIHTDLTVGNAAAWQFWETFESTSGLPRYRLVRVNRTQQTATPEKTYWALGHYSRFIRPGMVRVQVDRSDNLSLLQTVRDVMPTAFLDPATGNITLVLVNYRSDAQSVLVSIPGVSNTTQVTYYLSTDNLDMVRQNPFQLSGNLNLPARSIATLVIGSAVNSISGEPNRNLLNGFQILKSNGQFFLAYSGKGILDGNLIQLSDLKGRVVFKQRWDPSFEKRPLSLKPGVYVFDMPGEIGTRLLYLY